jgi:branched-subunit amino acid aminotransferase/4-amino-4-deoxychorismate lyase
MCFFRINDTLYCAISERILDGITRKSYQKWLKDGYYCWEVRPVLVSELVGSF